MIFPVLGALLSLILFVWFTKHEVSSIGKAPTAMLGIVIIAFGGLAGLIVTMVVSYHTTNVSWEEAETIELYGLSNQTVGIGNGSFLYVRLSAENAYTYWYPVDEDINGERVSNSYKSGTVTGNGQIIEEDRQDGVLVIYKEECSFGNFDLWRICFKTLETYYTFYVPRGTVAGTFELE